MFRRAALALLIAFGAACGLTVTGADVTSDAAAPEAGTSSGLDGAPAEGPDADTETEGRVEGGLAALDAAVDAGEVFGESDAGVLPAQTVCKRTAWILADKDDSSLTGASNALANAGFLVTKIPDYTKYDGAELDAQSPGVIVFLSGDNFPTPTSKLQTNIVNVLVKGTGLVTEEWAGYLVAYGQVPILAPYILFEYREPAYDRDITFTAIDPPHPVWTGLPKTFHTTSKKVSLGIGKERMGVQRIATVSASGMPGMGVSQAGVMIRESGLTRVAETSIASNYNKDMTLANDANVMKLFANMATWAAHCP